MAQLNNLIVRGSSRFLNNITVNGKATANEIITPQVRLKNGSYSSLLFNDGTTTYLRLTNKNDADGAYNTLSPFSVDNGSGAVTLAQTTNLTATSYTASLVPLTDNTYDLGNGTNRYKNINVMSLIAYTNMSSPYYTSTTPFTLAGGKLSGLTTGTSRLYSNGIVISNPGTANDQGWIRVTGTGESDTVLEIATGDDGGTGEKIVVRQYNTSSAVTNEAVLLDNSGNTKFPKNITATSIRLIGTVPLNSAWDPAYELIGADGKDKMAIGYLNSFTNGQTMGSYNPAMTHWSTLNFAASTMNFRIGDQQTIMVSIDDKGILSVNKGINTYNVRVGSTVGLNSAWDANQIIVGADGKDKLVFAYCNSSTNQPTIAAHNSALTAWAGLNIAASDINFRIGENIKACLNADGKFYANSGFVGNLTGDITGKWNGYSYGSSMMYTHFKTYVLPKEATPHTYYIQLTSNVSPQQKNFNFHIYTSGANTNTYFKLKYQCWTYFNPSITVDQMHYNSGLIKSIRVYKSPINGAVNDLYLTVDSFPSDASTDLTITIIADTEFYLDSDHISTVAPTSDIILNQDMSTYALSQSDYYLTNKQIFGSSIFLGDNEGIYQYRPYAISIADGDRTKRLVFSSRQDTAKNTIESLNYSTSLLEELDIRSSATNFYDGSNNTTLKATINSTGLVMNSPVNFVNGKYNPVGDDVSFGDINAAGTLGIKGLNGATAIQLVRYGATSNTDGVKWTCTANGASTITGATTFTNSAMFNAGATFIGSAAAAGLKTRGICGLNSTGTANDALFLNYDGNELYTRKVYLGGTTDNAIAVRKDMLNTAISDIEIGGRNLFGRNKGIAFENNIPNVSHSISENGLSLAINSVVSTIGLLARFKNLGFNSIAGDYTFSAYVSATNDITVKLDICDKGDTLCNLTSLPQRVIFTATNVTSMINSTDYNGFLDIESVSGYTIPANTVITFRDVKIERGNKATDWTPAPEDKADRNFTEVFRIGGTNILNSNWNGGNGTLVVGKDGVDKVVMGYVTSPYTGASIGVHNSTLNAWSQLNVCGSIINFRINNTTSAYLYNDGKFYDSTGFVGPLFGNATSASALYNSFSSRPTSLNFNLKNQINCVTYALSSGSTTTGKVPSDAGVITIPYDSNGYGAQIAVGTNSNPSMYIRGATTTSAAEGSTWDANWKTVLDSSNYNTYAAAKSHTHSDATTSASGFMNSSDKINMTYFVEGTQTAATSAWTGTLPSITAPYDGLTIRYYLPYAGSGGATLNINNKGAYPIYKNGRSTQITTHFGAGSIITLTFRSSYNVSGTTYTNAWIVDAFYDSNDYSNLSHLNGRVYAGAGGIMNYSVIALDDAGAFQSFTTTSGTGTTKTINTAAKFKLPMKMFYYNANNSAANGALVSSAYCIYSAILGDTRYSHNYTTAFVQAKPIYIEGNIDADGYFSVTDKVMTQTPTAGNYYVFLGIAYSTVYQVNIEPSHPCFYCPEDGVLIDYTNKLYAKSDDLDSLSNNLSTNYYDAEDIDNLIDDYYTKSEIDGDINNINQDILDKYASLTEKDTEIIAMIENSGLNIDDYIRFMNGLMELGYKDSMYIQKISGDKISFLQNNVEIASIQNGRIISDISEIQSLLTIGTNAIGFFDFVREDNGSLSIKWREGEA